MQPPSNLSGTAFVVNVSRARRQDLSQDIYAHLWVTADSERLYRDLCEKVYPSDEISTSLRNRFYLEEMRQFLARHPDAPVLNLAAGFSSYPFLIEGGGWRGEADLPAVIEFKRSQVGEWRNLGTLPDRKVEYFSADVGTAEGGAEIANNAGPALKGAASFVMMEGLSYYLEPPKFAALVCTLAELQSPGSLLAFETWTPDASEYPVYNRLLEYLEKDFGQKDVRYNLMGREEVAALPGYGIARDEDIEAVERRFAEEKRIQSKDSHLPIHFWVLSRT